MIFSIDDASRSQSTALVDASSGEGWSYSQLTSEVSLRCNALRSSTKALVFQFCRNTLQSVAWYLAALEIGHAVALLAETLDHALRQDLIARFEPDFVILPQTPGDAFAASGFDGLWERPVRNPVAPHAELGLLLSTSGSTGSPKFVRLTRRNVEANAASIREALAIDDTHRPIAHLPLHYSYGLSIVNSHLLAGATTVVSSESLIRPEFWQSAAALGVNSFSGVPYTYAMLKRLDIDRLPAASIRIMTQAGGKLDSESILHFHRKMAARGGEFWVMYGQTEAVARIAILPAHDLPEKVGSAGRPIPGGSLAIATDSGVTAEAGVEGELVYRGPNVMWGYATEREDLARGDELQGVLYTGDRARLDEQGYVYILGRAKRDAKLFGLRINLDEVEAMVKVHGPAAVVGGKDKLLIYCEFGNDAHLQRLHSELSARLKIHGQALEFRRIEKLPTNASGKIDYSSLNSQG